MTELSGFWTTDDATPEGDQQASYNQAYWTYAFVVLAACNAKEGVAPNYLNELAGTASTNNVAIASGGGLVDGKWFRSDASQDVTIPSSSSGKTRIDRIVLRADWAGFNVSVYRIAGTEGDTPSAPAITQTSGTTYDIMLYQALVNSSGTVTLTDERVWAVAHTDGTTLTTATGHLKIKDGGVGSTQIAALSVRTTELAADAVNGTKIADDSIDSEHIVPDSIDTEHIAHGAIGPDQIAAGAVNHTGLDTDCVRGENIQDDQINSEHYVPGSIDHEHLADGIVENDNIRDSAALSVLGRSANSTGDIADIAAGLDGQVLRRSGTTLGFGTVSAAGIATAAIEQVKLHPGASKIIQRQGGDATDWYVNGTNNYSLASSIASIQTGSIASGSGSDVTVTFGAAFSGVPIVLITWEHVATGEWLVVTEVTAAHVVFSIKNAAGTKVARQASWMALGPYIEPG